jgi:hypothetical protein
MLTEIAPIDVFSVTTGKVVYENENHNATMYAFDEGRLYRYVEYRKLIIYTCIPTSEILEKAQYILKMAAKDNPNVVDATHKLSIDGENIVLDLRDRSKFVCVKQGNVCGLAILDSSKVGSIV